MTTIYICTWGGYSDYKICGVFDSEELANKFAQVVRDVRHESEA